MTNNVQKVDILVNSYDVFKSDKLKKVHEITEVIEKMFEYDCQIAIEMWKDLVFDEVLLMDRDTRCYTYTDGLINKYKQIYDVGGVINLLKAEEDLAKGLYENSRMFLDAYSMEYETEIFKYMMDDDYKDLDLANTLLNHIYNNTYNHEVPDLLNKFMEALCDIEKRKWDISPESIDFLLFWTERVVCEVSKARIMVKLIDYI